MSSELDSLRQCIIELEVKNAEVKAKYIKVMDENAEVKAENAKLRCALEEHEVRFTRLEQRDKEKTNLIAKMDDDIKEIKQSSANASSVKNPNNIVCLSKLEKMANPLILMYANLFAQKLSHWKIKRQMISWMRYIRKGLVMR